MLPNDGTWGRLHVKKAAHIERVPTPQWVAGENEALDQGLGFPPLPQP